MAKKINLPCVSISGFFPRYQSNYAAGADLQAAVEEDLLLKPGQRELVPTGLRIELPEGFEAQIRPRSGLAVKQGITIVNAPGTIDSDYRGEIKVLLINLGHSDYVIKRGDRIAQMVICPVVTANFIMQESLNETFRGRGGFGSTGK
ncbi:MAG: dUTP diphosphatase [Spirochaeta sp.]|nr:dUTP diphosphatase [Spirochaeta sp.]